MGFIVQGQGGSAKTGCRLDGSQLEGRGLRPVLVILLPGELPQVSLFRLLDGKRCRGDEDLLGPHLPDGLL